MLERVLDHGFDELLALRTPVDLLGPGLLDRSGVDSDANRDLALLAGANHGLDFLAPTDISRIDAQAVHARFGGHEGQPVVEVNVGHERRVGARANLG